MIDGWLLVAGGVHAGGVKVFERVKGSRHLKIVAANKDIKALMEFLWI